MLCTDCTLPNEVLKSHTILEEVFAIWAESQNKPANVSGNRLAIVGQQLRGGADKALTRPGRKQGTATKQGIYSTYSS